MKHGLLQTTTLATCAALLAAGCENLTPGQNAGVFGTTAGLAAGGFARAAGASTAESFAIGAGTGAVVAVATFVIAKHQATARQRQVVVQRARVYQERVVTKRRLAEVTAKKAGKKYVAKKTPRYIAVDTERDEKTSPKAKKAVMIWDTQSESVVGNNVYDVQNPPQVGSAAKFETLTAEYVGSGN